MSTRNILKLYLKLVNKFSLCRSVMITVLNNGHRHVGIGMKDDEKNDRIKKLPVVGVNTMLRFTMRVIVWELVQPTFYCIGTAFLFPSVFVAER